MNNHLPIPFKISLASSICATLIVVPVNAQINTTVHNLCVNVKDYSGCVRSNTSGVPSRIVVDQGISTNEGNSCPHGFAYRGGGNCTEVTCYGKGMWIFGESNDSSLAGTPSASKDDASPTRPVPPTRGLNGAEQCVVTTRRSKLM